MKRIAIDITNDHDPDFDYRGRVVVNSYTWDSFVELAERFDLSDGCLYLSEVECIKCGSFLVHHYDIMELANEVICVMDKKDFEDEFSDCGDVYNFAYYLETNLYEALEYIDPDYESEFGDIAIIFDNRCPCNDLFVGKPEPQETDDDSIDFNSTDFEVSKYIGPKRIDDILKNKWPR